MSIQQPPVICHEQPLLSSVLIIEFTGTFFLVLCITLSSTPIAVGAAMVALVFFGGHISNAHYNPAVTLGVLLSEFGRNNHDEGGTDWSRLLKRAALYVVAQLIGGFGGAVVGFALADGDGICPRLGANVSHVRALAAEFIFTLLLVSVMLNVGTTTKNDGNSFYGLAIGCTIGAAGIIVGPISGAVLNPAVGTGTVLAELLWHHKGQSSDLWIYWIGPLLGGVAAAMLFRLTGRLEYTLSGAGKYTPLR